MPANKDDKRKLAEIYYVEQALNYETTAEKVGVDPRTVSKWALKGKWDELKLAYHTGPQKTLDSLVKLLHLLVEKRIEMENPETDKPASSKERAALIDEISKVNKSITTLRNDKPSLRTHLHCLTVFMDDLKKHDADLFMKLLDFQEQHVIEQAELLK